MKKRQKTIINKNNNNADIKDSQFSDEIVNKFLGNVKNKLLKLEMKFNDKLKIIENNIKNNNDINVEGAKINSNEANQSNKDDGDLVEEKEIKEIKTNVKSLKKDNKDKLNEDDNNYTEIKDLFVKSLNSNTINTVNNINYDTIKYDINNPEDRIYQYSKDNEIYLFIYKYTDQNSIKRLRCYDINCKGTAKLTENGSIEIINNCNIQYSNHNYHKKEIIWYKIRNTPKI